VFGIGLSGCCSPSSGQQDRSISSVLDLCAAMIEPHRGVSDDALGLLIPGGSVLD
jgi:hypothetical protein